jgi:Leucine-rich repeat (LRR) protein
LDYRIEINEGRKSLVCFSEWSDEVTSIAKSEQVTGISYVPLSVRKQIDVGFLSEFPTLLQFTICVHSTNPITNFELIYALKSLESLNCNTYWDSKIDFTRFKKLQRIYFYWNPNESLFECKSLKEIVIEQFAKPDPSEFSKLKMLEDLALYSPKLISLRGIPSSVKKLSLFLARSLREIEDLTALKKLNELTFDGGCKKIEEISPIGNLLNLEKLTLDDIGHVRSFVPLSKLNKLRKLHFIGTTNVIDGDLSLLLKLPLLTDVIFQNRKHYSHSREYFQGLRNSE